MNILSSNRAITCKSDETANLFLEFPRTETRKITLTNKEQRFAVYGSKYFEKSSIYPISNMYV
jgi:hypothetical protein